MRRHLLFATFLLLALLVMTHASGQDLAQAAPPAEGEVIHTVQTGENLFRIGLRYNVAWQTIAAANGISGTYIYVGQQLVIPGTLADPPPAEAVIEQPVEVDAAPPAEDTAVEQPQPAPVAPPISASGAVTHVVQRGDVLSRIAQRYVTTVETLVALNQLANPNLIYAGQTLLLPDGSPLDQAGQQAPPPAPPAVAKRILVDLSDQRMYVYENGQLIWQFVVSTGMAGSPTAPGSYHVQSKIPSAYGSSWNIWMPNWLGIYWVGNLENGIHALPIMSNGSQLWAGYLGTPISYGCVVLSQADSDLLWAWADIGTPVDIQW